MKYKNKCVFVMPTHNTFQKHEENKKETPATADEVLKKLIKAIKKNMEGTQHIIIIDDGSTDGTDKKLTKLLKQKGAEPILTSRPTKSYEISKTNLHLTTSIWRSDVNRGLNFAFLTGYKEALKREPELIIKLDSDGKHDAYEFPKLLDKIMERPTEYKLVLMSDQDVSYGFGFRLVVPDALERIINRLESFAKKGMATGKDLEQKTRGLDRKTIELIKKEFGEDTIDKVR